MKLKTDFKNEILSPDTIHRTYDVVKKETGETVHQDIYFVRKDVPLQEGDVFAANEVNITNETVNRHEETLASLRTITVSTSEPSGGKDGDIHLQIEV